MLPTGVQQLILTILFVIPGFILQATRSRLRGPTPDDKDLGVRVLRALGTSVFLGVAYVLALPTLIVPAAKQSSVVLQNPRIAAIVTLVAVFAIPVLLGLSLHIFDVQRKIVPLPFSSRGREMKISWRQWKKGAFGVYSPMATAWDYMWPNVTNVFVRILTKDKIWMGGYLGGKSFVSAYPEPREIFLEKAYRVTEDGEFGDCIAGSSGIWVNCADVLAVQLVDPVDHP